MSIKEHIVHSAKYFVKIALLIALIYGIFFATGSSTVSAQHYLQEQFTSPKGLLLLGALLLIVAVYPYYGFIRREARAGLSKDREAIINAFHAGGYHAVGNVEGDTLRFRASSPFRKLIMVFDDKITVTAAGEHTIIITGIRKEVVQAQFRIETYLRNSREESLDGSSDTNQR